MENKSEEDLIIELVGAYEQIDSLKKQVEELQKVNKYLLEQRTRCWAEKEELEQLLRSYTKSTIAIFKNPRKN